VDGAYVGRLLDWAADRPLVFKVDLDAKIGFAAGLRVTPAEILGGNLAFSTYRAHRRAGGTPISTRLKVLRDVTVENSFRGIIGFVQVSAPLWTPPPAAPAPQPSRPEGEAWISATVR
jgi:hypothetical protein